MTSKPRWLSLGFCAAGSLGGQQPTVVLLPRVHYTVADASGPRWAASSCRGTGLG
ncbi:hypothetical protein PR001_g26770 [Phytophthora rubi]|uniref:Uncharacterized protein n=1 Tax=Phytophthora rubi TaxID=129364 RepID=A0A6A3HND6_9STRA|nr:hypothetical protein PR002_g26917 [Phytophthora rubi]KAE8971841.1 hypothetical protein PR001_g26770 [Phytophthora rubi]